MEIPTPPAFVDGNVVDAEELAQYADCINFLLTPPRAKIMLSTGYPSPKSAYGIVPLDVADYDNDGMFDVTTAGQLTIQTPGIYDIVASIGWVDITSATVAFVRILRNGTDVLGTLRVRPSAVNNSFLTASAHAICQPGDYLQAQVYHNNSTDGTFLDQFNSFLSAVWLAKS